jgi:hypothetical protein
LTAGTRLAESLTTDENSKGREHEYGACCFSDSHNWRLSFWILSHHVHEVHPTFSGALDAGGFIHLSMQRAQGSEQISEVHSTDAHEVNAQVADYLLRISTLEVTRQWLA